MTKTNKTKVKTKANSIEIIGLITIYCVIVMVTMITLSV